MPGRRGYRTTGVMVRDLSGKATCAYPVVSASPNRLGSAFRRRLGEVGRTSYVFVVRGFTPGPEAEQGPKGSHRLLPTIVPKHELVQIDLKLRFTDAVVRADQPLLHVANGAVRQRHDRGGAFAQVAPEGLRAGYVLDPRCNPSGATCAKAPPLSCRWRTAP